MRAQRYIHQHSTELPNKLKIYYFHNDLGQCNPDEEKNKRQKYTIGLRAHTNDIIFIEMFSAFSQEN